MSIKDRDNTELVSLPGFWTFAFKFALVLAPVCATGFLAICGWTVKEIFSLDGRVRVLEYAQRQHNGVSQNVNVGQVETDKVADQTHRDWLTVQEVAASSSPRVTDRTVLQWIEDKLIDPPPMKSGKSWLINPNFRKLPSLSATLGKDPNVTAKAVENP